MPYQIAQYVCEHCHSRYDDLKKAQQCQTKVTPEPEFDVGDKIIYQSERQSFNRWIYDIQEGTVLYRFIGSFGDKHGWVYLVQTQSGEDCVVRGDEGMMCSADDHFRPGFVDVLKADHEKMKASLKV